MPEDITDQSAFEEAKKQKRYGIMSISNKLLNAKTNHVQKVLSYFLILGATRDYFHHQIEYIICHPFLRPTLPTQPFPRYGIKVDKSGFIIIHDEKPVGTVYFNN